jgi:5-methylthioadenosine/S-adenosylhomocysteine deaminase
MSAVPADLSVSCRWILPMTARDTVLENHTLVVRDGRILDVLPSDAALQRYAATVNVERPDHALLPGLVNAHTRIVQTDGRAAGPEFVRDAAMLCIAEMLKAGTTCFCDMGYLPDLSARMAAEQGLRAVIGLPVAETSSSWAKEPRDYLTRALSFRDEYRGHPSLSTAFAPHAPSDISDATLGQISVLAAELDAAVLLSLHESQDEVAASLARHGLRPIERMQALGLLTPSLTAVHMVHVTAADRDLALRGGIAVTLCPESNLRSGNGPPAVASWAEGGARLGLGSGTDGCDAGFDLWSVLRQYGLLAHRPGADSTALAAWDALSAATQGGAAALGLDSEIGTLQTGKWADLCCVDLRGPAMQRANLEPHT